MSYTALHIVVWSCLFYAANVLISKQCTELILSQIHQLADGAVDGAKTLPSSVSKL